MQIKHEIAAMPASHMQRLFCVCIQLIESIKTTSMEMLVQEYLKKNKEQYLRSKDKAEKWYDVSRHIQLHVSK